MPRISQDVAGRLQLHDALDDGSRQTLVAATEHYLEIFQLGCRILRVFADGLFHPRAVLGAPLIRRHPEVAYESSGNNHLLLRPELAKTVHHRFGFFRLTGVGQCAAEMQQDLGIRRRRTQPPGEACGQRPQFGRAPGRSVLGDPAWRNRSGRAQRQPPDP